MIHVIRIIYIFHVYKATGENKDLQLINLVSMSQFKFIVKTTVCF